MSNGQLCQTAFSDVGRMPQYKTIREMQKALNTLEAAGYEVKNCNCTFGNCCQSIAGITCQSQCTNQSCQGCQSQCKCQSY